MPAKVWR